MSVESSTAVPVTGSLAGRSVLVIGRGSGIARATVLAARDAGARVVAGGRHPETLAEAYAGESRVSTELVDITDDASLDTKVIGPLMLAKHLGPRIDPDGSFVLFSGVAAFKIAVGTMAVAITNGAADTLTRSLALELAPVRVNAISPGVIDTGAWDALGDDGRAAMFADVSRRNPVRRIGTAEDIASAVLFALTNSFLTGATIPVDGGEELT